VYLQVGTEDENALIVRCLAGESAAFQPLVERYYGTLFRVASRMLHDREAALDATQTAFMKAYQTLGSLDRERRFFSWIYRILVNDCLNVLRARRSMVPLEAAGDRMAAPPATDDVGAGETRQLIRTALLKLPAEQREVILLRHFGDMSYAQVATALGISEATVKSRLFSGRQRLCELLATEKLETEKV
jgi:RNA polymerase sigma-70 factor, ECF subfamily